MSMFYRSLTGHTAGKFQKRKKKYKEGKPCAVCGRLLKPEYMMVAHLTPARELTDEEALFDETNWEVRCLDCEHKFNRREQMQKNAEVVASQERIERECRAEELREQRRLAIQHRKMRKQLKRSKDVLAHTRLGQFVLRSKKREERQAELATKDKDQILAEMPIGDAIRLTNFVNRLEDDAPHSEPDQQQCNH